MKKHLDLLSVIIAGISYLYLIIMTATGTGEGLSISTFALLGTLGWITSYTTWKSGNNPGVAMSYAIGATATAVTLIVKGRYGWSGFDTAIAAMVLTCIVLLLTSSNKLAIAFAVAASAISFVPFVVLTWKFPATSPVIPNTGFLIANVIALIAAKSWKLEARLYPTSNTIICALLVLPWIIARL